MSTQSSPAKSSHKQEIPGKSPFPLILSVAFAASICGAVYVERFGKSAEAAAPAPVAAVPAAPTPAAEVAAPAAVVAATVDDLKGVKADLEALAKKVADLPKPEPTPDLKPILEKVAGLAKTVEASADAPKKLEDVANKLAASDKTISALKGEVESLKAEVAALKAKPATPVTTEPAKPVVDAAAMTAAADLFKANKFAEALAAFQQLPADDARVLYYTALATGFSTNKWEATGDAATLAAKAQQAEKAGTPAKADIDAAFAGLKETQGKKWLDFYRGSIK